MPLHTANPASAGGAGTGSGVSCWLASDNQINNAPNPDRQVAIIDLTGFLVAVVETEAAARSYLREVAR
jgi:hypothetical protein